jgi:Rrf2 family protein
MKISKKTDYALRTLVTLTENFGRGPIPIRELARRNDIPKRFLEHILLELKEQGWVESVPGRHGGYILGKSPKRITMGQVVRLFDGVLAPIKCVSVADYMRCSQEPMCRFRRILLEIRNRTAALMDQVTLDDLVKEVPVSEKEIFT